MLIRNWLSCALIVLLALQAVLAVADVHQPHQSGKEHLTFDHQPESAEHLHQPSNQPNYQLTNQLTNLADASPSEQLESGQNVTGQYDCHHCCHCHGAAPVSLLRSTVQVDLSASGQKIADTHVSGSSWPRSPDLPPPIA